MDDGSQSIYVLRLKVILLISSVVSLVILLLAAFEENLAGDSRRHQMAYRAALIENAPNDQARAAAERYEISHKQVFLPQLGRIDRCVTCHVAMEDPSQASAMQPLQAHSGDLLESHPISKFGCTVCHDGQGRATTKDAAHGEIAHATSPLLRGETTYTSCGRCHYENDLYGGASDLYIAGASQPATPLRQAELASSVPGSSGPTERAIGRGKQLVLNSGCLGCHEYRGRGGNLGPDITHVGDKTRHDFDFTRIQGEHTVEQWMFEHFKNPAEVVPGTLMPDMGVTDRQARDLTQYMLSLRRKQMPAAYTPVPPNRGGGAPVTGQQLYSMFCSGCHGNQGQGSTVLDPQLAMLADPPRELMTPAINNTDTLSVASDEYLRHIIRHGRHGTNMIGWSRDLGGLDDKEIERLVAFIRAWSGPGPDIRQISAADGVARYGRSLFRLRCASCHGQKGDGGIGPSLASPSFLAIASDEFIAKAIVHGRANTAMPSWRHLNAQQVSDLLAYIRSWQKQPPDRSKVLDKVASNSTPTTRQLHIGKTLYRANCGNCHGSDGEGGIGPSLNHDSFLSVVGDDYLYDAIVKGRPGTAMPAWSHLGEEDLVDLITFMRSWNDGRRTKLEPWLARGDWDSGEVLFRETCAGCHGSNGEGLIGPQLNNPEFLASASDAMLRHWVRYGKHGTQMRAFLKGQQGMVEITDARIEDVITFIRRWEFERPAVTSRPGMGIPKHGELIYRSACAACHGTQGEGITGSALANPDFLRSASDGYLLATIALGRDGTEMRPMGKGAQSNVELSPEDMRNLVSYIRSWERNRPEHGTTNVPPRYVIGADLLQGQTLYAGHCAGCHGATGLEGWAPSLNNRDFLMAASDGFLQATIARGRSHTPMRPFGRGAEGVAELDAHQIDNIVAFIRSWAPAGFKPIHGPQEPPQPDRPVTPLRGGVHALRPED